MNVLSCQVLDFLRKFSILCHCSFFFFFSVLKGSAFSQFQVFLCSETDKRHGILLFKNACQGPAEWLEKLSSYCLEVVSLSLDDAISNLLQKECKIGYAVWLEGMVLLSLPHLIMGIRELMYV